MKYIGEEEERRRGETRRGGRGHITPWRFREGAQQLAPVGPAAGSHTRSSTRKSSAGPA